MSDIMSHMDLAVWPIIGLILFLAVFTFMVGRALLTKRTHSQHMAAMPLDDEPATPANRDNAHNQETHDVA